MEGGLLQSNRCWWWIHEKKKKTRKDLYTYGLNINFTNHWSTWSGRQIRKGSMWFIWCFQMGGISSECKKDMGLMRGNFIARLCKSSSLLLGTQRAVYLYDHLYQHLWSKMALPFFISYCCVFLSLLCISGTTLSMNISSPAELDPIIYDVCLW